jgi:RNA-directed DNA polymerase
MTDETRQEQELPKAFAVNGMGLPVALFTLRQKLYRKAKQEPGFRFYSLYGLSLRLDVLEAAWKLVSSNDGAPGVDGVTIKSIVVTPGGPTQFIAQIREELLAKKYKPQAVRRVFIPKANGKRRPLGIPTVRDRVVQMAVKLILEPIFEADFLEVSFGFRPARSAHDALREIERNLKNGYQEIYDADLQAYFDTIPHDKLMKCVERRVADGAILRLIRQWLVTPVEDRDENDRPKRSRPTQGTPQGGVISPLLANIYLHWMDVTFSRSSGPGVWAKARLVRYADDFVIMAKHMGKRIEDWVDGTVEGWLGLAINREKTRIVRITPNSNESLDFLGYTFQYEWDLHTRGKRYLVMKPSHKALVRMQAELRAVISTKAASPVATSNSPTRGRVKIPHPWYSGGTVVTLLC